MEHVAVLPTSARAERETARRPSVDKRMTAEEAVQLIHDGDHVAIGGTLYSRTPMALVFALLKKRRHHLTVSRPLACYEIELFLSTGALDRIVSSWVGIGLPWGLAPIFRHYVERGEVAYDEWSHLAMGLRYKAGAMGVPFLPTLTMLGSDLATRLDLQTVTCPYTGERLAAVPALNPDVALIHAHRADMLGNVQVDGYQHMDVDMARAARTVIVSAEQIVSPDEIAARPDRTMLPHFAVDAVVAAPHGAYPHECYGRYGPDLRHFDGYAAAAKQHGPAAGLRYVEENADARLRQLPRRGRPGPPSRAGRRRRGADPAMSDVTAEELMAITASRLLADHKVVFAGVGMPLLAAAVARHRHAPHLTIVLEGGIIGTTLLPGKLPISTNEMRAAYGAQMLTDITDIFLYAQRGYFDYGFLGAAQVDMYGNINTSVIGTWNTKGPAAGQRRRERHHLAVQRGADRDPARAAAVRGAGRLHHQPRLPVRRRQPGPRRAAHRKARRRGHRPGPARLRAGQPPDAAARGAAGRERQPGPRADRLRAAAQRRDHRARPADAGGDRHLPRAARRPSGGRSSIRR